MNTTTKNKILNIVQKTQRIGPSTLSDHIGLSRQMVQRYLKTMVDEGLLEKIGTPPKVFYKIKTSAQKIKVVFDKKTSLVLEENFYHITPTGKELVGKEGFVIWCSERNFNPEKKVPEFIRVTEKYQQIKKNSLIDATAKLKNTFSMGADKLYYYDFYSVEIFGKTKMGQKLLYAKQSENKKLMKEIGQSIRPALMGLITRENVDAIAYVPPTVPRQIQFMKILEKELSIALPKIAVLKVISDIRVPQKTLKKLSDRIENANETFVVDSNVSFKNVLLIDDAVGSGASINQIAQKIKERGVAKKVVGFSITGSLNDFDVISEV